MITPLIKTAKVHEYQTIKQYSAFIRNLFSLGSYKQMLFGINSLTFTNLGNRI